MKKIYYIFAVAAILLGSFVFTGCEKFLTTNPSTEIPDANAISSVSSLQKVLISAYKQLLFNTSSVENGDRIFGGIPGMQMYWDLRGQDIMSHENMGGSQVSSYSFSPSFTRADGDSKYMWSFGYALINQCNIILDALKQFENDATEAQAVKEIKGQCQAMRAIANFYMVMSYQQTYAIAKDKRGIIIRTSSEDPTSKGFSTVQEVYDQITTDLSEAKANLANFKADQPWKINQEVVMGWQARVYQVMQDWKKCYEAASAVYGNHSQLLTKEQWYSGFDDCVKNGYQEVVWAITYTNENNMGGGTQFNFWHNQDPGTYGEAQTGIYRFFDFFATEDYVALFDEGDWRGAKIPVGTTFETPMDLEKAELQVMFWHRQFAGSTDWKTKWVYNKWKHYGDEANLTVPDICLMRGTEMLLIMAEALANQGDSGGAIALLNKLQSSRGAKLTTVTEKNALLEEIYIERRKELLGEGVTGQYDLVRLQKSLTRKGVTDDNPGGHYPYGVNQFDGYSAADPIGTLPSNDYRWFFQIPDAEFSYNTAIDATRDQNPFSGR